MRDFRRWALLALSFLPSFSFATWQIAGSPIVVHSVAPNTDVPDYPRMYWNNPVFDFPLHPGSLEDNVDPYAQARDWKVDWQAGDILPVFMATTLKGPSFSYVLNLLFEHYPVAVIYDDPNHLVTVLPIPKTPAAVSKGFWVSNGEGYYKVYDGLGTGQVRPQGRPSTRIPLAMMTADLRPGSLKANVIRILRSAGWTTIIWDLPYDYNWVGSARIVRPSVQAVLQTVLADYPLQAAFYEMNHVVVIQAKSGF